MSKIELIKYNGSPSVFAWKFPFENLGTWTQLIVNESQEAVLFKGGQALDWFGPGRHTLSTANIPILSKIINMPFGKKSPFFAEIWYVNKINALDLKWGTPTPIQLQDPKYSILVPVRAYGQFGIRILDSKIFLTKIVGTLPTFEIEDVTNYFQGMYLTKAKDLISNYLVSKKVSILDVNAHLSEMSENLKSTMSAEFAAYGIELVNFYVNAISVPEGDPSIIKLREALANKANMDILGYTYQQERTFDTLESAAKNTSAGIAPMMGTGIGLGMGLGLGNSFGNAVGTMGDNLNPKNEQTKNSSISCPKCNTQTNTSDKFCNECGYVLGKICSKCSSQIVSGQKFCSSCGHSVVSKCTTCNSELRPGLKFCGECGQKVDGM